MIGLLAAGLIVVAIVLFVQLADAKKRIELLEANVRWMRGQLDIGRAEPSRQAPAHPEPSPAVQAEPTPAMETAPAGPATTPEEARIEEEAEEAPSRSEITAEAPAPEEEAEEAAAFEALPAEAAGDSTGFAPPPSEPPPSSTPPPSAQPPSRPFDWESLVGVKLFSGIAGVALVLAAVFFLRYSVQQGWLSPAVRATIGLLTGASLIVVCELRISRAYTVTANAMHGAAIAVLYATLFAIHALWHLLSPAIVFPLMIVVTAIAVLLAIRRNSLFIALLGLIGGFATPALLSSGENRPIGLFTYLLFLNVGLAAVGYRRRWPALTLFSVILTVLYQWGWIAKFMTASQMPLAAGIFVVFAAVAAAALWIGRNDDREQSTFDQTAVLASALPLAFGLFAAAVPAYGARYNLLFGFLLLVTAGLGIIAFTRGPRWLHLLGGGTALLVFAIWLGRSWHMTAFPGVLGWIAAFVVMYLAFAARSETQGALTAPLLFFTFPVLLALGAGGASVLPTFAVIFVLLAGTAVIALWKERGSLYFVAAMWTVVAEAVWSAKYLNADLLISGLAIYGIFALFFLGVPLIAQRFSRQLAPRGAAAVLVIASIAILLFLTTGAVADAALWGMAVLLAVLNAGALMESRETARPILSLVAIILSWIVIGVWWSNATIGAVLVPALMVVAGFSVLIVAGNLWAGRSSQQQAQFDRGIYAALAGHLFLLFVASRPTLAIPPWPVFAVVGVLDLAIGAAALYLLRQRLFTAAVSASQLILLVWCVASTGGTWPHVTLAATLVVVALAVGWFVINRGFAESAVAALAGSYVVAMAAGDNSIVPLFGSLLASHAVITIVLLVVAAMMEWYALACFAAVATAFATFSSRLDQPLEMFVFAFVLYGIVVAYPLILGPRVGRRMAPHLGAVMASVWFFFAARDAMGDAKLLNIVGVLPVGEAIVLLAVLWRVLRTERVEERNLTRLATIAGSALAFITAAVPLQLDKQWITIAWALEGAALVWLFRRIPHRGLLVWAGGLLAIVLIRLSLNPAVLSYHATSSVAVLNWFLYTYLICAAAMFAAAWLFPSVPSWATGALNAAGTLLLFLLLNIEIADFYSRGSTITFNFFSSSLAQDLTYTIGWALFAMGMLVAGILTRSRASRVAALVLLLVTILKCFLHDLARLGGLYRVGSLLGLAVSLVVTGILLQKYVMQRPKEEVPAA